MSSRRYGTSEVTFDERKERDYSSRSRYDDSYVDQEIKFRRSAPPPVRERDREEIDIREERTRARDPPDFLRDDYGRSGAGPVVLRAREREDFDFVTRPRRRSPSPEPERKSERESIVIRRDEEDTKSRGSRYREQSRERDEIIIRRDEEDTKSRGSRYREQSRDREEIIIRRDERERARPPPPPPPPEEDIQREEIIIRREERSRSRPPARDDRDVERIIIRRRDDESRVPVYEPPPPPREYDREEIIIRRDRDDDLRPPPRRDADYRPKSRERERSTIRHDDSDSEREIIIRRDKTEDRGRETEREEIIIRSRSNSRSPSPARSVRSTRSTRSRPPPMDPPIVYAPQIHQEVVTHHRHIDHGYELAIRERPRPVSRPPSPPSPPPPQPPPPPAPAREQSEERIEIRRSGERNGRAYDEDIVIDRNEGARSVPPPEIRYDPPARREVRYQDDFEEDYYSSRALESPRRREADYTSIEISRERDARASGGDIGRRYGRTRDPKAGLWTEVTKDLVIKEAITEMGYEYEETDEFYYIIAYLEYDDVARLVGLSEEIRKDRRKRVKEIEWENRIEPEPPRRPLAIEAPLPPRRPRPGWDRADERFYEREVVYRDRRPPPPPPPPGWRR